MDNEIKGFSLDGFELQKYQPNRYPFLMIDYVTEVVPGKSAKGYKNLTNDEWFFPKHFEGHPNMPGALQLEAMAQMLTVAITTLPNLAGYATHALKHIVRFRKEIFPGECLKIESEVLSWKRGVCRGTSIGLTHGTVACEAEMWITIPEIFKQYLPPPPLSSLRLISLLQYLFYLLLLIDSLRLKGVNFENE